MKKQDVFIYLEKLFVFIIVVTHALADPMRPLLWTSKSTRKLVQELKLQGFIVNYNVMIVF